MLAPGSISLDEGPKQKGPSEELQNHVDDMMNNADAMLDDVLGGGDGSDHDNKMTENTTSGKKSSTTTTSAASAGAKGAAGSSATKKKKTTTSVFDRLYNTQTASSRSHYGDKTPPNSTGSKMKRSYTRPSPQNLTPTKLSYAAGGGGGKSPSTMKSSSPYRRTPATGKITKSPAAVPRSATGRQHSMEYSIRMKPLTKLYFITKFHPGIGLEPVDPLKLGYTFFQSFCDYENGAMDSEQISKEIIVAFFKQDFPSGRHWQMKEPDVRPQSSSSSSSSSAAGAPAPAPGAASPSKGNNDGSESFVVSMSATYDWEDAYRVATARGIVRFKTGAEGNKEIRVENYSYHLTGDA